MADVLAESRQVQRRHEGVITENRTLRTELNETTREWNRTKIQFENCQTELDALRIRTRTQTERLQSLEAEKTTFESSLASITTELETLHETLSETREENRRVTPFDRF